MRDSGTPELWRLEPRIATGAREGASPVRNIVEKISPQTEALNVEFRHGKRLGKQIGRKSGAGFAEQDPQQGRRQIDAVGNGHQKAAGSADAFTLTRGTGFADQSGRTVQNAPHARSCGHRSADFGARRNRRREKLATGISRAVVPTPRPRQKTLPRRSDSRRAPRHNAQPSRAAKATPTGSDLPQVQSPRASPIAAAAGCSTKDTRLECSCRAPGLFPRRTRRSPPLR